MKNKSVKVILLLVIMSLFTFIIFSHISFGNNNITKGVKKEEKITRGIPKNTNKVVTSKKKESTISELKNYYNNSDIIARLVIDDLNIDEVITKTSNNTFYLDHDLSKDYNELGTPYIDYRNDDALENETQINIYGHNTSNYEYKDNLSFSKLENYMNEENFDNSNIIKLITDNNVIKYEVVAIKVITDDDNEHTVLYSSDKEKWKSHLNKLLSNTTYCKDECSLTTLDKLLILQTCNYNPIDSYILLIAKKIN